MSKYSNKKIFLITQYFKVKFSNNIKAKQEEIDYTLIKNINNLYIDKVYLLLEEDYDISFVGDKINKVEKVIIGKRLTYKDAFDFYNNNLKNNICLLANADIYFNNTVNMTKYINWDKKIVLCLNRYEHEFNNIYQLYGKDTNLANGSPWVEPYAESVYSQDAWIWSNDNMSINDCDFMLGTIGCDNYISRKFYDSGYIIMNTSHYINITHYDHLSNDSNNIKGNESKKRETRVGTFKEYLFLDYGIYFPDNNLTNLKNIFKYSDSTGLKSQILTIKYDEIIKKSSNICDNSCYASSSSMNNFQPYKAILNSKECWIPEITDKKPIFIINFKNRILINFFDIQGCSKYQLPIFGYIKNFSLKYLDNNFEYKYYKENDTIKVFNLEDGIYIDKIHRFYLDNKIITTSILFEIKEWVNIPCLRLEIYLNEFK